MKKVILVMFLVFISFSGCKTKKSIEKTRVKKDSVSIIKSDVSVKSATKDSLKITGFENYFQSVFKSSFNAAKIKYTETETAENPLRFVFDVNEITQTGDTLKSVDVETGAQINIFPDEKGKLTATVKPQGRKQKTFEAENIVLQASQNINTQSNFKDSAKSSSLLKDSIVGSFSETSVFGEMQNINKKIIRTMPVLYWAGASVVLLLLLVVFSYLFRNKLGLAKWVWDRFSR